MYKLRILKQEDDVSCPVQSINYEKAVLWIEVFDVQCFNRSFNVKQIFVQYDYIWLIVCDYKNDDSQSSNSILP